MENITSNKIGVSLLGPILQNQQAKYVTTYYEKKSRTGVRLPSPPPPFNKYISDSTI